MDRKQININRETKETRIHIQLNSNRTEKDPGGISTPIGFFSHMLESFRTHGRLNLNLKADGDIHVDQHHLIEDCGIGLGQAFDKLLGDRTGISRAGFFLFPMDDALSRVVIDFGGRPYLHFEAAFKRRYCGDLDLDLLSEFFMGFAVNAKANLSIVILQGKNDHHKAESIFKAFGRAVQMAISPYGEEILSTKGVI